MPRTNRGWPLLLAEAQAGKGWAGRTIPAYSEFMPPPLVGVKPSGAADPANPPADDPFGWNVSEYEEAEELGPGLERVATRLVSEVGKLSAGLTSRIPRWLLAGNPAWPGALASRAGTLEHETGAVLFPLALSRTQDDKGRVRWTLFGADERGPARAFWRSFLEAPDRERPDAAEAFERLVGWLAGDLAARRVRVLPLDRASRTSARDEETLPGFARRLVLGEREALGRTRAVVTFRPFARLPRAVQEAYLEGAIRLLPSPASLVFWWHPGFRGLAEALPYGGQIPLLSLFPGNDFGPGFRIPHSGWLDEVDDRRQRLPRTHRFQRVARDGDDEVEAVLDDRVTVALFSTVPEAIRLYGKPLARNCQIWSAEHRALLDGPRASRESLLAAARAFEAGGRFGYRLFYPPMRVGDRSVFWRRPIVGRLGAGGRVEIFEDVAGHVTAEREGAPDVELWPRRLRRAGHADGIRIASRAASRGGRSLAAWTRKLLEWRDLLDRPLPASFAARLLRTPRGEAPDRWFASRAGDGPGARRLVRIAASALAEGVDPGPAHTYEATRTRDFEERYWRAIAELSTGPRRDKNNADVILVNARRRGGERGVAQGRRPARVRHLEGVRDLLAKKHRQAIARHGMTGRAFVADHVFRWETEFDYPWWGGWVANRDGRARERNLVVVIPGADRGEAIVMADHYDTAYMEDLFDPTRGGDGLRAAACGADDNHSATAALLLAAEVLLPLARDGRLARDVWLVHLTGEEFPADCLGARALASRLVGRDLVLTGEGGEAIDLSAARARGVFVLDMIAHNVKKGAENVFQIAPGEGAGSARLAWRAHLANERWNRSVPAWNRSPERRRKGRSERSADPARVPAVTRHPALAGEIRPEWDPRSALFNTDGQIFSDAGVPVVLFMENYDICRAGYHDTLDTMANIDLDYGAALAAIAIETVADCAIAKEC